MDISIVSFALTFIFLGFGVKRQRPEKTHNYTQQVLGWHYFLSPAEENHKIYMTADRDGVHCHDYILLKDETGSTRYQVEIIEHYDASTIWTALLVRR
ncbi:MAG: hypothetical protein KME11_18375 [Timaviella obliquedivisa GSE-PSE-MK23-08B]|jgi:hypothetical protein|nr:hypothetical protein [Timaviella obliquedivisa GSE-PSE-MK23-08B]